MSDIYKPTIDLTYDEQQPDHHDGRPVNWPEHRDLWWNSCRTLGWNHAAVPSILNAQPRLVRRWIVGQNETPPFIVEWLTRLANACEQHELPFRMSWNSDPKPWPKYDLIRFLEVSGSNPETFRRRTGMREIELLYIAAGRVGLAPSIIKQLDAIMAIHRANPPPTLWWPDGAERIKAANNIGKAEDDDAE